MNFREVLPKFYDFLRPFLSRRTRTCAKGIVVDQSVCVIFTMPPEQPRKGIRTCSNHAKHSEWGRGDDNTLTISKMSASERDKFWKLGNKNQFRNTQSICHTCHERLKTWDGSSEHDDDEGNLIVGLIMSYSFVLSWPGGWVISER